jgi:hypothetical protein
MPAQVLCGALRVIHAGLVAGDGRLLIAECGGFGTPLAKASDEALERRVALIVRFERGSLFGHGGLAGEDELRNVGEGDGVAAPDALASELADEIAEEEIDLIGGSETVDVGEKLCGEDLRIDRRDDSFETIGVVSAERGAVRAVRTAMIVVDQHVAAAAFGADVLALMIDGGVDCCDGLSRHGGTFLIESKEAMKQRGNEVTRRGTPSPHLFCKRLTRQGLRGGGRIKDCGERS